MSLYCLNCVTFDQLTLGWALAVSFEYVYRLDGVLGTEESLLFYGLDWLNDKVGKKLWISIDKFWRHWGLGAIGQGLISETFDSDRQLVLNVSASFSGSHLEPGDNVSGVNIHLNELIGSFEQLSGKNDNTGGSVADFRVLQLGKLDQEVTDRMFNFEFFQYSGT